MTLSASRVRSSAQRALGAFSILGLVVLAFFLAARLLVMLGEGYSIPDRIMALLLLGADLFLCLHGLGFLLSVVKSGRHETKRMQVALAPYTTTRVAVLVAAFNEAEDVLEETISSVLAMDYPSLNVYLLDDSTKPRSQAGTRRLAEKYGLTLVQRTNRAGYKAGAINDLLPRLSEPYLALLDADQRPLQSWLKEVVPLLDADPGLAFVQAPQVYVNTAGLPVAAAARYQQAIFFEYICEGKAATNAMYCCGSNVLLRREALLSIETQVDGRRHFFDETSVTEDFATSLRLHARGWRTAYVNNAYVVGMGPETLAAYFTQQMRWSMGTLGVGLRALALLLRGPRMLRPAQWWEYLLSCTYYLVGFCNFIFMLTPLAFVAFGIRPLRTGSSLYAMVFLPYIAVNLSFFFLGMRLRGHPLRGVWLATALSFGTFWTYMKAAFVAILGLKRAFGVTPKGVGGSLPLRTMKFELAMLLANAAAALWGLHHLVFVEVEVAWLANTFWAAYHVALLSTLFLHFNRRVDVVPRPSLFEVASLRA